MSSAAWGFVGVIVGGLITATSAYLAEWRTRRHQRGAAKSAALIEIEEAIRAIELSKDKWAVGWALVPWSQTWPAIQSPLADGLKREAFRRVRTAYGTMFLLQHGLMTVGGHELTDENRKFFCWAQCDLAAGQAALGGTPNQLQPRDCPGCG